MKNLFSILSSLFLFTSVVFAQENQNTDNFQNLRIDEINVRYSAGLRDSMDTLLNFAIAERKMEQDKLDEARTRRRSVSKAMAKMIAKIKVLTERIDFIKSEIESIPLEVKNGTLKALSEIEQGDRNVILNIQVSSFIAAKKRKRLWPSSYNSIAATVVVIDSNTNEIIGSLIASDVDVSQYSANTAAFKEGAAIGLGGLVGIMAFDMIAYKSRTEMIEGFSNRTISAFFTGKKSNE